MKKLTQERRHSQTIILSLCSERLHYFEFVQPIEDILGKSGHQFKTIHYKKLTQNDLDKSDRVIICGTSLKDFGYAKADDKKYFGWLKFYKNPVLGICAGMQILVDFHHGELKSEKIPSIGLEKIEFVREFLGIKKKAKIQAYQLHQSSIEKAGNQFEICALTDKNEIQAIKHKELPFYGVLFHPEVRNKNLIENFLKIE